MDSTDFFCLIIIFQINLLAHPKEPPHCISLHKVFGTIKSLRVEVEIAKNGKVCVFFLVPVAGFCSPNEMIISYVCSVVLFFLSESGGVKK